MREMRLRNVNMGINIFQMLRFNLQIKGENTIYTHTHQPGIFSRLTNETSTSY